MLAETQGDLYFNRMASSIGDKSRMLPFIREGAILDVGAGGGELSEFLRLHGNNVTALDGSIEAINRIQENYPEVETIQAFTYELESLIPDESFDTIVCCSILHEVYSYGDPTNGILSLDSLIESLQEFYKLLKPGGRLIIRDGVMPTEWDKTVTVRLKNQDAVRYLEMYKETAPFYSDESSMRKVSFKKLSEFEYSMNLASAMEFLYTLTWGWESSERETQELYGVFAENDYCEKLKEIGFSIQHSEQYLQPEYPEHLLPVSEILDAEGNIMEFPSSNMIIVAEKPF